jgi:hypothetical protein
VSNNDFAETAQERIGTRYLIARYLFQGRSKILLNIFGTFATAETEIEKITDQITVRIPFD